METLQTYLVIFIPGVFGLTLFGVLRRRDTGVMLSGCAAAGLSLVVIFSYFAFIIFTGRV